MKVINGLIKADEGKWINRKGDNAQFKSAYLLPNDTIDNFEERTGKLPSRKYPYEEEVERRIRLKYSLSEELAIGRQRDTKKAEFEEFYAYCEQCKADAKAYEEQWYREEAERERVAEEERIAWEKAEEERRAQEERERLAREEAERKEREEQERLMAEEMARMEAQMKAEEEERKRREAEEQARREAEQKALEKQMKLDQEEMSKQTKKGGK